jgi:D-tyrosyl-tRNA(Tyr) deacylase
MRVVLQRVTNASVSVMGNCVGSIGNGFLVLLGMEHDDTAEDVDYLVPKIVRMRVFNDTEGKMNVSAEDNQADFLVVSQFTLYASTKKGNRPSFVQAARPEKAVPLYQLCTDKLQALATGKVENGVFGADMKVELVNDGPVTIWLDSKRKE